MSVKYNITAEVLEAAGFRAIHAGDDYAHDFTATRGGNALDIDGGKVWFTVKEDSKLDDTKAKLQYDSDGAGITITDGPAGEFTLNLADTDTAGLEGLWPYDIKARLGGAGAAVIRLARGKIEFLPNLTRAIT
jgi:hypothetical protein